MSRSAKGWAAVVGSGMFAVLVGTGGVDAQKRVSVDGHGGIAVPTGRFAEIANTGPSLGVQMSYPMSQRTALRVQSDVDQLRGARMGSAQAPDIRMWRAGVGVDRELFGAKPAAPVRARRGVASRPVSPWALVGSVGVGATRFDSSDFTTPGSSPVTRDFKETYLATEAGLTLRYRASERVQLRAGTQGSLTFADRDDTAVLAALDPRGRAKAFGSTVTVPVSLGLTIRM